MGQVEEQNDVINDERGSYIIFKNDAIPSFNSNIHPWDHLRCAKTIIILKAIVEEKIYQFWTVWPHEIP